MNTVVVNAPKNTHKNVECLICKKSFTYNGLRSHMKNFISGKHVARSSHGHFTPEEHKVMLDNIKKTAAK